VRIELAAVYRMVDAGKLDHSDATKRAYVLTSIAKVIELAEIEARITALEERQTGPARLPAPSYGAH
jgi:DNA-binding transcriptional regulator PaaX